MPIKAVLFDMFDTLIMIERNHAFYSPSIRQTYEYLRKKGVAITFDDFEKAYVEARDALYALADPKMEEPHFNLRIVNALKKLGYSFTEEDEVVAGATNAFCETFMTFVRIDDDAVNVLKKLQANYKLGIVSNFALPECVAKLLQKHDLARFFDVVIVSGAVNKRKPSPEIFRNALDKLGVEPSQAAFVGDTVDADVLGPKRLGMKTVYIERRPQKDLENTHPDQTIKSLAELPAALELL